MGDVVVSLDGIVLDEDAVTLLLRTTSATARCPACDVPSHRVHSRYVRAVVPAAGKFTIYLLNES